jgi:hypothetical protein
VRQKLPELLKLVKGLRREGEMEEANGLRTIEHIINGGRCINGKRMKPWEPGFKRAISVQRSRQRRTASGD